MALRSGWFKRSHDPYWDFFINTPPTDPANSVLDVLRKAPEGNVFPTKADLHTPEVTTSHVKEMARYLGADLVGVTALETDAAGHPFAIVCAVRADDDPRQARGVGGQVPVQNGLFVTFVLSAWIRELGYRASAAAELDARGLAAAAKLGTLDRSRKLVTREYGTRVHVADVIRTDLPLAPA
ncbi:MAG: hypothetical protein DME04_06800 [Candidatus Rokuibacteriota bacterium]|nr:MAG: hypothetical protein DME04_06800 [Candidatus Rokubacteria bacterium]